jgi:NADH dehydrogenase [ubiquinone] 1 alpha subcomplex assembly factor 5
MQHTAILRTGYRLLTRPVRTSTTNHAARLLYSTAPPPPPAGSKTIPATFQVFNRETKRLQKERAASNTELSRQVDYVKDEVAFRVVDRLLVHLIQKLPLA